MNCDSKDELTRVFFPKCPTESGGHEKCNVWPGASTDSTQTVIMWSCTVGPNAGMVQNRFMASICCCLTDLEKKTLLLNQSAHVSKCGLQPLMNQC